MKCIAAFFGSLLLLASAGPSAAEVRLGPGVAEAISIDGEARVLVWVGAAVAEPERAAQLVDAVLEQQPSLADKVQRRFQTVPAFAATVDAASLAALQQSAVELRVDLDVGGSGQLLESIPLAGVSPLQGGGLDGQGRKVVIVDSGLRLDHQSFAGRIVDQACFCTTCCPNGAATQLGAGAAADAHGHGSNVGGIAVGAAGVSGVPRGVASAASIVAVRVLDQNNGFCCASDIIAAFDWVRVNHPDATVLNASLGTSARFEGDCDAATSFTLAFANLINGLRAGGTLSTVSSGNNGVSTTMQAPACAASALSVAAVYDANVGSQNFAPVCTAASTAPDQITCFSNLSSTTDLLAPGAPVTAAGRGSPTGVSIFSGTSMAAPMTAGCIALLKQAVPGASPAEIEAALEASTVRLLRPPMTQDYPRLDCGHALLQLSPLLRDGFEAP